MSPTEAKARTSQGKELDTLQGGGAAGIYTDLPDLGPHTLITHNPLPHMFIIATKPDLHPLQLHKHHVWGENSLISVIRALVARDVTKITESCNVSGGGSFHHGETRGRLPALSGTREVACEMNVGT